MPDLSIKVGFRGPLLAKNEKAKTRKNQGFMRVFCVSMGYKKDIFAFLRMNSNSCIVYQFLSALLLLFNCAYIWSISGCSLRILI